MVCCGRAEACAATESAEAMARWVNIAPSPVNGNRSNSDNTSSTVRVTNSNRHCAGKTAHEHTLAVGMHINFSIEDYRKELECKCKISISVALKAPVCALFNVSPGPPVGAPLNVRAPLEPIKGRERSLEHRKKEGSRGDTDIYTTHKWT
jgi:hypothetical protein